MSHFIYLMDKTVLFRLLYLTRMIKLSVVVHANEILVRVYC